MSVRTAVALATALAVITGCVPPAQNISVDEAPMSSESKDGLRRYFAIDKRPKAFAFAPKTGDSWYAWNYATPEKTQAIAISKCEELGSPCELYAINDVVVWRKK